MTDLATCPDFSSLPVTYEAITSGGLCGTLLSGFKKAEAG